MTPKPHLTHPDLGHDWPGGVIPVPEVIEYGPEVGELLWRFYTLDRPDGINQGENNSFRKCLRYG